ADALKTRTLRRRAGRGTASGCCPRSTLHPYLAAGYRARAGSGSDPDPDVTEHLAHVETPVGREQVAVIRPEMRLGGRQFAGADVRGVRDPGAAVPAGEDVPHDAPVWPGGR